MSGRSSSGAASPSTPAAAAAVDDETYPRWCLTAMLVITLIAFGSHAAPTDWLRSSRPVVQVVAAQESKVSTELFAAPSALPHAAVLEEVRREGLFFHGRGAPMPRPSLAPSHTLSPPHTFHPPLRCAPPRTRPGV